VKKECEDTGPEMWASLVKGIPGGATDCFVAKRDFTCEFDMAPFIDVTDVALTVADWCGPTCEVCGGGQKCVPESPLPEGISNTEVTEEGKEAFHTYSECVKKECEDTGPEMWASLVKGIPGGATDCFVAKRDFTCEFDMAPFIDVTDVALTVADWCGPTCEVCGGASPASSPSPNAEPRAAPKPAPKPTPATPKPSPAPAPSDRPDSATDKSANMQGVPLVLLASMHMVSYTCQVVFFKQPSYFF